MNKGTHQTPTDKLRVIDLSTFECMQQSTSNAGVKRTKVRPVKNSKYKRIHKSEGVDLLQYVVVKSKGPKRRGKILRRVVDTRIARKRGKTREGGIKKRPTRLKKSILLYREKKRREKCLDEQLSKAVQQLEGLIIAPPPVEQPSNETEANGTAQMVRATTVHSRTFRAYCDNLTSATLAELSDQLLRDLNRFQVRAIAINPIKARANRRLVIGFREVQNYLSINKLKLVLIATDCEDCVGPVGLNETIASIKECCQNNQIPCGFTMRRRQLAYALYKKVPVGCVGIVDYDGARDTFDRLLVELAKEKAAYRQLPSAVVPLQNINEMESKE